jgi:hypothetical protein
MDDITLEKRLKALEKVAHAPQNYRRRCMEMERKVEILTKKLEKFEKVIVSR